MAAFTFVRCSPVPRADRKAKITQGARGSIVRDMSPTNMQRSNCQFVVQQTPEGNVVLLIQLLHQTIPPLNNSVVGFDLLGGTRVEQAKKVADLLNEYVLGVFVKGTEKGTTG